MEPEVALLMAEKIDGYHNLIEAAWGIIANAGGGNWSLETTDWQEAAERWRDRFHAMLDTDLIKQEESMTGEDR